MTTLTASLPMYNLPEMARENRQFWEALERETRRHAIGPGAVTFIENRPPVPNAIGREVFFSQTCGYPLGTIYRGQYRLLGRPDYDAPGCEPGMHCAFLVVREDASFQTPQDLRGARFALNSRHSNSGMNLPRLLFARLAGGRAFFAEVVETGSHPASLGRVAAGELDVASVDCLTYALLQDRRPASLAGLRVLAATPSSPTIPFVTSITTPENRARVLQAALLRLGSEPEYLSVREGLRLRSIGPADPSAYARLLEYEREAAELGYPELA